MNKKYKKKYFGGGFFLLGFFALVALFSYGLFWAKDPKKIPSALVGKNAPSFSKKSLLGEKNINLKDFQGKILVINFFASWCVPCKREALELEQIWQEKEEELNILAIAVNDTKLAAIKFIREQKITYFAIQDDNFGNISLDYGVSGIPETFFLNSKGIIVEKITGAINKEKILAVLNKL